MRSLTASILLSGAGLLGLFQWSQIVYRLRLFWGEYHAVLGVNHIADGDFALIYFINALGVAAVLYALYVFWRNRGWRAASIAVALVNVCGWVALFIMHRTGMLVEYGEFLRYSRGEI